MADYDVYQIVVYDGGPGGGTPFDLPETVTWNGGGSSGTIIDDENIGSTTGILIIEEDTIGTLADDDDIVGSASGATAKVNGAPKGMLVCTGTNVTSSGINTNIASKASDLSTIAGSNVSTVENILGDYAHVKLRANIQIGDGTTASAWALGTQSIIILCDNFRIHKGTVTAGVKTAGIITNTAAFSLDSTSPLFDDILIKKEAVLNIHGGKFFVAGGLDLSRDFTSILIEECDVAVPFGIGTNSSGTYGNTPTVTLTNNFVNDQLVAGINIQSPDIVYDITGLKLNTTNGVQIDGTKTLVGIDFTGITTGAHVLTSRATGGGDVNCIFVDCGVFDVRFFNTTIDDVASVELTYDITIADSSGTPIEDARLYLVDEDSSVRFNGLTLSNGKPDSFPGEGAGTWQETTWIATVNAGTADGTPTERAEHTRRMGKYGFIRVIDTQNAILAYIETFRLVANNNTTLTAAQANALTGIVVNAGASTLTATEQVFELSTSLTSASETSVVITITIPTSTAPAGIIAIERDDDRRTEHTYTSYTGSTFTIVSSDFLNDEATSGVDVADVRSPSELYDYTQDRIFLSGSITEGEGILTTDGANYSQESGWELITDHSLGGGINFTGDMELSAVFDIIKPHNITGTLTFDVAGTYEIRDSVIDEVDNTSGGSVIINKINTTITTNSGPSITVNNPITVTVTVLDATTGLPISGARVFIEDAPTEFVNDSTDANGEVAFVRNLDSDTAVTGTVRKGTTSIKYKSFNIASTITIAGNVFALTVQLIPDE